MTANIRHSSEHSDFMTPEWLVEMSRHVLGKIELDPASSEFANRVVRAERIFTKEDNGLFQEWHGSTFLNCPGGLVDGSGREVIRATKTRRGCTETGACGLPPGHKHEDVSGSAAFWWHKLMHEHESGRCPAAIFVGFSLELLQSAQGFAGKQPLDFPSSIPKQRIKFELEVNEVRVPGDQPTHANVIVLVCGKWGELAEHDDRLAMVERFTNTFSQIGYVHVPRGY